VRLELLVLDALSNEEHDFRQHPVHLSVRYFHSQDVDMGFVVLKQEFDAMRARVAVLKQQGRFLGSLRSLKTNPEQPETVKILSESALESSYGASQWLSLEVIETKEYER